MYLRALIFHVPTYLCAYVLIYIFRAYVSSCLKLYRAYVRSFFTCLRAYSHSQNILRFTSRPRIVVFLWIIEPFLPFKTPKFSIFLIFFKIASKYLKFPWSCSRGLTYFSEFIKFVNIRQV